MPKSINPKVTFYIDENNRNKDGLAPIKANITFPIVTGNYQTTTLNKKTGERKPINKPAYLKKTKIIDHVLPSDWKLKQQRVRPARPGKDNGHEFTNAILDKLQTDFDNFIKQSRLNNIALTQEIAAKFLKGERIFLTNHFGLHTMNI